MFTVLDKYIQTECQNKLVNDPLNYNFFLNFVKIFKIFLRSKSKQLQEQVWLIVYKAAVSVFIKINIRCLAINKNTLKVKNKYTATIPQGKYLQRVTNKNTNIIVYTWSFLPK